MSIKLIAVLIMALLWAYKLFLTAVDDRSMHNPIPETVSDIYDAEKYKRWQNYHRENCLLEAVAETVDFAISLALILTDAYAWAASLAPKGPIPELLAVLAVVFAVSFVCGLLLSYVRNLVIEEKYGFNRMTVKRLVIDHVKSEAVSDVLMTVLVMLLAWIHMSLGKWTIVVFSAVLVALLFLIIFLFPLASKLFSKFEPLEDGELKERLVALLNKYGYTVKAIEVKKASERTTKSNAYFAGFGKTKTIVLYDTTIANLTTDEIVAVFAHEMGHGLHRDTIRQNVLNAVQFIIIGALLFLAVSFPALYTPFGFAGVNYGFAFVLLSLALPFVTTVFSLVLSYFSRRAELAADRQAVEEGMGDALISALKKLADENFSNLSPSRLLVVLEYSHPTLDARITAIREAMGK